jgi:aminoglycoside 3-N-acetyltransferase
MQPVTANQVSDTLFRLGIRPGDGLLIHSAIQYLGYPEGGLEMYYRVICRSLNINPSLADQVPGVNGTLAAPAFNFAFAQEGGYDPMNTPSVGMGAFSEYVRTRPEARRTPHPMQSLAVVGGYAADLASRDTLCAFDSGSAFERMLELGFKLLLLGADIQAVSMLHYSEQRAAVPYRYWKEFSGSYRTPQGWERRSYRLFARDLDIDARIELYPVQKRLQEQGQWCSLPLNYGEVAVCRLADLVAEIDRWLAQDPWSLVTNRPTIK